VGLVLEVAEVVVVEGFQVLVLGLALALVVGLYLVQYCYVR
jgi:hypothetical protein